MHLMQLRLAESEDASIVATVLLKSFVDYKALYTDKGFAATTPSGQEVLERLKEGPIWLVVDEGEIVGTASAVLKGDSLYIRGMAGSPAGRAQRVCGPIIDPDE